MERERVVFSSLTVSIVALVCEIGGWGEGEGGEDRGVGGGGGEDEWSVYDEHAQQITNIKIPQIITIPYNLTTQHNNLLTKIKTKINKTETFHEKIQR